MPSVTATCPFCGLLCDDLIVEPQGDSLHPVHGACERSLAAFARLGTAASARAGARIGSKPATQDAALDAAAQLLRQRRRPLICGLGTDVAGMRATLALARRIGAVLDHAGSRAKYRNLHVLQEFGWITTTLAEVRNRADLLMLIGDGWHARFPRFVERVLAPARICSVHPPHAARYCSMPTAPRPAQRCPSRCERLSSAHRWCACLRCSPCSARRRAAGQPIPGGSTA